MDFIENKQNWKTGESSFWEFIIFLWIVASAILIIVIFSFKLYILPKFQEYRIKHPQSKTKVLKNKKKTNIVKDKTFNSTLNKAKNSSNSHYELTAQTEIDKNGKSKPTKEERKMEKLKQQEKIDKKELKAEIKRIKQEKKLQQKLEKQKLKRDKKNFTKIENNENSIEKNDIENSSQIEEEEKGE